MVSALDTGSSGPGFGAWPGTLCCVLGQDTLTVPLSTQVYQWVPAGAHLERATSIQRL